MVDLGEGRRLRMIATPGHARHHMAVLDEATGTVLAGDAAGLRFAGAGPYPALPPPDIDPVAGDRSLGRARGARTDGALPGPLRPGRRPAGGDRRRP